MKIYDELVWRGLIKDISSPELEEKLNNGGMTFYIGTDPTGDSLHIGHFSSFLISKRLKDAGHHPILLVGGATGLIGDPKPDTERPMITKEQVQHNFDCLAKQAKEIIITRLDLGITFTEFSYMIMQALDFYWLHENKGCTLQVAGQDQWGNITAGIELIRKKTGEEAYGFTMPLLTKSDGTKFGKTNGKAIWLDREKTSPYEMYQFFINSEDDKVIDYLKFLTFLTPEEIMELEEKNKTQPHLREAHKALAKEVITFIHGEDAYNEAVEISQMLFSGNIASLTVDQIKSCLQGVPTTSTSEDLNILDALITVGAAKSKREAREFTKGGSVMINGQKVTDESFVVTKEAAYGNELSVIRRGKKNYFVLKHE